MVHVRVDPKVKQSAEKTLDSIGTSISDIVRVLLQRVASEKTVPFVYRVPNAETRAAIRELEEGRGKTCNSFAELMAELNADD
jgi:DNA-damage-inducible protein J